jgi:aspartate racemase
MKTAGILGGIGPESTIEYYRSITRLYREQKPDGSYPCIIINSIDMNRMLGLIAADKQADTVAFLGGEILKLARGGADFGLLASNTPHIVFDALASQSPIPLISIVEVTCEAAKKLGLKRAGLFGTRFTMEGQFYSHAFGNAGIALAVPAPGEQSYIHDKYMSELVNGILLPETREGLLKIAARLRDEEGIDGLILGGTELPPIMRDTGDFGIPFLDTTRLHVESVVSRLVESV